MVDIPFLKKITFPRFDFSFSRAKSSFVGIDIGSDTAKVVQLRKEQERAILETYGELKTSGYFKHGAGTGAGFLRYLDKDIAEMLKDLMTESNITTNQAVFSIPSVSSFVTAIELPLMNREELKSAIPLETKRYIPIPTAEVEMDWEIIEKDDAAKRMKILLVVVPKEVISKYKRIAELAKLEIQALEVESFSLVRSLIGREQGVVAIVNLGAESTTVVIADNRVIKMNHNIGRGFREISTILSRSLAINEERAEVFKKEVGLSTKPEEREIAEVIRPIVDSLFADIERVFGVYNRSNLHKAERIILCGGGASMSGLIDYVSQRMGLETTIGNPFLLTVYPAFMQPILKDMGPRFGAAAGLALRQVTSR